MTPVSDEGEDASSDGSLVDKQDVMSVASSEEAPDVFNERNLSNEPPETQRDASAETDNAWLREVAAAQHERDMAAAQNAQYEAALEQAAVEAEAAEGQKAAMKQAAVEAAAAEAQKAEVNGAAHALLRDNLEEYLQRHGDAASFEGWIGQLHPENVDADGWIDMRLCLEGSEHRQMWAEATSDEATRRRRAAANTAAATAAANGDAPLVDAALGLTGHVFSGMTAGASLGFAAMHGALGCGVEGVRMAKGHAAERGAPKPLHAALRVAQASLELADLCALGAMHVAVQSLAAAGGATCGLMARSGEKAAEERRRLREKHEQLRWRDGPGEGVLRATGVPVGCGA